MDKSECTLMELDLAIKSVKAEINSLKNSAGMGAEQFKDNLKFWSDRLSELERAYKSRLYKIIS